MDIHIRPLLRYLFLGSLLLAGDVEPFATRTVGGTLTVTTTNGSGPGSLLVVVTQANSAPGDQTIEFAVSGTLRPLIQLPTITNNLTFTVRGTNQVILDGQGSMPIFLFAAGSTSILNRLSLVNGRSVVNGGAVRNAGTLFVTSCVLSNNSASGQGGAVFNSGKLTLLDARLIDNQGSFGGAIFNSGKSDFTRCVLSGNRAGTGAAIQNEGSLSMMDTTLSNNSANAGFGGGIFNSGALNVTGSTISENSAPGTRGHDGTHGHYDPQPSRRYIGGGGGGGGGGAAFGAGLYMTGGNVTFTNSTIVGNSCIGGAGGKGGNGDMLNQGPVTIGGDGGQGGGAHGGTGGRGFSVFRTQEPGADGMFGSGGGGGGGGGAGGGGAGLGGSGGFGGGAGGKGGRIIGSGSTTFGNGGDGGNGGGGLGSGLFCEAGELTLVNCSITGNFTVGGDGGNPGIAQREDPDIAPVVRAAPGNRGQAIGGGIFNLTGTVNLKNTIVTENLIETSHADLSGSFLSSGFNLIGNNQGASGLSINDFQNVEAKLGPFQDNGGRTWTCALLPGSPAIGAGTSVGAPDRDQRGASRPADHVDIGAFQVVTRILPNITWNSPADITAGTPLSDAQLNAFSSVPGTFNYTPGAGTVLSAGNNQMLTVILTPADLINFASATKAVVINIVKKTQNITFALLPDRHQDDPPFLLAAAASSSLPVSFTVVSGPAVVTGNLLTLSGATGIVTVRATQTGNNIYSPAPSLERSFNVVSPSGVLIAQHPSSQTVVDGDRAVLQVVAQGPALTYQWQFQNVNVAGETGQTLTLNLVSQAQAGSYRVIVSNSSGSAISQPAILVVRPKAFIKQVAGQVSITWSFGVLQTSTDLVNWAEVAGAKSPHGFAASEPRRYYRIDFK